MFDRSVVRRKDLAERLRLYVISDRDIARGRPEPEVMREAIEGGATCFQLRGKNMTGREMYEIGKKLRQLATDTGTLFIVNDRVDVAIAVQADGVHIGQDDLPLLVTRELVGRHRLVGVSAGTPDEAKEAEKLGADYLGVGSVFHTATKADAGEPIGLKGLEEIVASVKIPVVAIGGIDSSNALEAIRVGACGVAVISAIVGAQDVREATRQMARTIGRAFSGNALTRFR